MTGPRVAKKAPARRNRVPVSGNRDILTVEGLESGYVGRWVNDIDHRIQKYLDAGYVFVDPSGKTLGETTVDNARTSEGSVTSKYVGKGVTAYLMAQKKEWYDEDQAEKAGEIDRGESALNKTGQDGRYGETRISRL